MRKLIAFLLIVLIVTPCIALAHPGGTDSEGGHTDRSTGEYHYHHGYPALQHEDKDGDGKKDCPYDFKDATDHRTGSTNSNISNKTTPKPSNTTTTVKAQTTSAKEEPLDAWAIAGLVIAGILALPYMLALLNGVLEVIWKFIRTIITVFSPKKKD